MLKRKAQVSLHYNPILRTTFNPLKRIEVILRNEWQINGLYNHFIITIFFYFVANFYCKKKKKKLKHVFYFCYLMCIIVEMTLQKKSNFIFVFISAVKWTDLLIYLYVIFFFLNIWALIKKNDKNGQLLFWQKIFFAFLCMTTKWKLLSKQSLL